MTGMAIERDFRKLTPATQAELRRIAVKMVRAGKTRIEAAEAVGVNRRFVGQWVKVAAQRGEAALAGHQAVQGPRCERQAQLGGPRQRRSDNRAALLGGVGRRAPRAPLLLPPGPAALVAAFEPEAHRGAAQAHLGRDPRRTQAVNRVLDNLRTPDQPGAEFL